MADKDKKRDLSKLREKFAENGTVAADKVLEAYADLEEKLGEQGNTLGEQKKAVERYEAALREYQQNQQQLLAANGQMKQVYDWFVQNQPHLQQYQAFVQRGGNVQQAAGAAAQQTPGYDLLTAAEKTALKQEFAKEFHEQMLAPTMQRFGQDFRQQADQYANSLRAEMAQMQRASTEVLYNIAQQIAPPEKWNEVQELLQEQVRFSDPRTFNPSEMAQEHLKLRREYATTKAKMEQYEKEAADRERASTGTVTGTAPGLFRDDAPAPKNREERMAQTLTSFKNDVGREAAQDFFSGSRS